jgi:hypothetical protein
LTYKIFIFICAIRLKFRIRSSQFPYSITPPLHHSTTPISLHPFSAIFAAQPSLRVASADTPAKVLSINMDEEIQYAA